MMPDWLSFVDIGFVGVALLFAWGGYQRGFAAQVAHVLTFLVMGGVLLFIYPVVFSYLGRIFRNLEETYLTWMILIGVGLLALGIFILFSKMLANLLKANFSDRTDQSYGFLFGFLRGALFALFAMIFLVILGPPRIYETFRMKSFVGKQVCYELVPRIQPHLTRAVLDEKVNKIRNKLLEQEEAGVLE